MQSRLILCVALLSTIMFVLPSCQKGKDANQTNDENIEARIDALMEQLTLQEKITLIHASSSFTSGGVKRLNIPELVMSDGPHGVRHEHGRDWAKDENVLDSSTYLPVGTALAATWNTDLGYKFGDVLGSEAQFRGKDVILGPGLNIIRSPLNGRNFEYLTEDPYLNSRMVVGYIKGVQEHGVAASAKHYVANSLEFDREYVNVEMSDRALREIYLPGFKAAVQEGKALTVMAAYNKFRGVYCAHSTYLLDDILKEEYGFEGLVVSDWAAVKNTMGAVNAGLDIEMGTDLTMFADTLDYRNFFLGDTLISLVENGVIDEALIDKKVRRILRVMFRLGKFDDVEFKGEYNTKAHQQVARDIADEAIVLLKNEDNLLPLKKEGIKKLAIIGVNATRKQAGGGGSSQVKAFYEVTPLQGLQNLLGDDVEIEYAPGYEVNKEGKVNNKLIKEAAAVAKRADAVIYVGGLIHGYTDEWNDNAFDAEVIDKPDMYLPFGQDQLINALLIDNPDMVIVLVDGGLVDMRSWEGKAKGIVQAWYAGMEGGNALADILFGNVNPSGKLPMTFPAKLEDSPAHSLASYPTAENLLIDHKEDIFVGYRYFDTYEVEPAFAFGHGLSYTTFDYSDLKITKTGNDQVTASVTITNSGKVAGKEVVQFYVQDEASALKRPTKELKAFKKVSLEPGKSTTVEVELNADAFSYYDDTKGKWVLEAGKFSIVVGSSSKDIRLSETVEL